MRQIRHRENTNVQYIISVAQKRQITQEIANNSLTIRSKVQHNALYLNLLVFKNHNLKLKQENLSGVSHFYNDAKTLQVMLPGCVLNCSKLHVSAKFKQQKIVTT